MEPHAFPATELSGQRAADQAYSQLREDILSGRLMANVRLTEAQLSEQLNCSRTPVREAIRRLLSEGLLRREKGEGLRVADMGPDEIQQIFLMRLRLEPLVTRHAAANASSDQIAALRALADEIERHTPPRNSADREIVSDRNSRLHKLIMEAASMPRMSAQLAAVVDLGLVMRTYRRFSDRDMIRSARHHHEIIDAIEARDSDWAEAVMTAHLLAAKASMQ